MEKLKAIIKNYIKPIWYFLCAILISYFFVNMVYNAYVHPKEPDTRDFEALESQLRLELSNILHGISQEPYDTWSRFIPSSTYNVIMYRYNDLTNSNITKIEDNLMRLGWILVSKEEDSKEKEAFSDVKLEKEFEKNNMSVSLYLTENKDFSFFDNNDNQYEVFTLKIKEVFD